MIIRSAFCVAVLFASNLLSTGCEFRPDSQIVMVAGPICIDAGATVVIESHELIRTSYYVNSLCLQPSYPNNLQSHREDGFGILSADGKTLFSPTVLLRNANKEEDVLEPYGYQGGIDGEWICFSMKHISDQEIHHEYHSPYTTVEISSPVALNLSKVRWFSGDK